MDVREKSSNEKRLIDANDVYSLFGKYGFARLHVADIDAIPRVDAVEVVRCEKCKHAVWDEETKLWKCVESAEYDEESGEWFGFCEYHYGDYFCSYGERKDGGE